MAGQAEAWHTRAVTAVAAELVPGEVVLVEAGNVVPADLRLTDVAQLRVDESTLTGESHPVDKTTDPAAEPESSLHDWANTAFKGTVVTYGHAVGAVVATGMQPELGGIGAWLRNADEIATPLQRRIARFTLRIALAVLKQGSFSNLPLFAAVVLTLVLQLGTLRVPALNVAFKTEPLSTQESAVCLAVSTVGFLAVEGDKMLVRRGALYGS